MTDKITMLESEIKELNYRIKFNSELMEKLRIEILGDNWYTVYTDGSMHADKFIVNEIIRRYKCLELANRSIFAKIKYWIKDVVSRW